MTDYNGPMSKLGTFALGVYLVVLTLLLVFGLVIIWAVFPEEPENLPAVADP